MSFNPADNGVYQNGKHMECRRGNTVYFLGYSGQDAAVNSRKLEAGQLEVSLPSHSADEPEQTK